MDKYFDIHTHIIPGVDDGSDSLEESMEMIKQMADEGVGCIIATPHYPGNGNVSELIEKYEVLRKRVTEEYPDIKLYLGNELLNGPDIIQDLKDGKALTLGETRYILVEFLPQDSYKKIYSSLREYIYNGFMPIVAHIERYKNLYKEYGRLEEIISLGAYLQMNTESLVGNIFDRQAAYCRRLLCDGYIHFLGSDCHSSKYRRPLMRSALKNMKNEFLDSKSGRKILYENPEILLKDKYL